jgi:hypothetical protein
MQKISWKSDSFLFSFEFPLVPETVYEENDETL